MAKATDNPIANNPVTLEALATVISEITGITKTDIPVYTYYTGKYQAMGTTDGRVFLEFLFNLPFCTKRDSSISQPFYLLYK